MSKYNFAEKDLVAFDFSGVSGYGSIVGVATTDVPILGCYYMIKVNVSNRELPNDTYPFTTISMPEIGIVKLTMPSKTVMIDDVPAREIYVGTKHVLSVKLAYMNALCMMPQPERDIHVKDWADSVFAISEFPSKVTVEHLHQLLRYHTKR